MSNLMVWSSITVIPVVESASPSMTALAPLTISRDLGTLTRESGLMYVWKVNSTSWAVTGVPSCQVAFFLRKKV